MSTNQNVLIASRSKEVTDRLKQMLGAMPGISLVSKVSTNGHADPLHGATPLPTLLILDLSAIWEEELNALSAHPADQRPAIIAIGPEGNTKIMRMAMKVGARDFFTNPVSENEFMASVKQVLQDTAVTEKPEVTGKLTAVINAKGGSGASFVACNIAQIIAAEHHRNVMLIDMDLQFGSLPLYLDLSPKTNSFEALSSIEELDAIALRGSMTRHSSGIYLLASNEDHVNLNPSISPQHLNRILDLATQEYNHIIIDLPRHFDRLTTTILQRANRILIVMQQSLTHIRDTKRMHQIITSDLVVPEEFVHILVNRFDKINQIGVQNIKDALPQTDILTIPSDFKRVSEAINMGVMMHSHEPKSQISRSLVEIAQQLDGVPITSESGRLMGAINQLFGR